MLWFILALLLIFLGVGGYLFCRACCRVKDLPWLDKEAILKTDYAPHADAMQEAHQWLRSHGSQDLWITSRDGLQLHGQWVPAENPIGSILMVHGYHSTYLADFGRVMGFYHRQGLNLLVPDQRCHAKSGGSYTTFGVKESQDMLCWLEKLNQDLYQGPILMTGVSMGASTVMYAIGRGLPENVVGAIVDCGFTSPADIIGKVFTDVVHLPPKPWIYAADLFARLVAGFSLFECSSLESLKGNTLPLLMAHGKADDFVPCAMTEKAFAVCTGDKRLHLVEGAGHGVSFLLDPVNYGNKVKALLADALGEAYELRNHQEL